MSSFNEEYNNIVYNRERLAEKKERLENEESIRRYRLLNKIDRRLLNEQHSMYERIQTNLYDKCNHILVYTRINEDRRGRIYKKCGCIKCGLDENKLGINRLSFEDKVMQDYLKKHKSYINGLDLHIECDLSLGMAVYSKILEKHPNIDDSTAVRYFMYAINHIKFVEVSEERKQSRAKRLLLEPDFDNWKSPNDIKKD
jgi:hypothetical protein